MICLTNANSHTSQIGSQSQLQTHARKLVRRLFLPSEVFRHLALNPAAPGPPLLARWQIYSHLPGNLQLNVERLSTSEPITFLAGTDPANHVVEYPRPPRSRNLERNGPQNSLHPERKRPSDSRGSLARRPTTSRGASQILGMRGRLGRHLK